MPSSSCDERKSRSQSRLEASLMRLYRPDETDSLVPESIESAYTEWQNQWASRRDEIVRRLEVIDSHLEGLVPQDSTTLRLAVIGASEPAFQQAHDLGLDGFADK